jgi:hypothetical protein
MSSATRSAGRRVGSGRGPSRVRLGGTGSAAEPRSGANDARAAGAPASGGATC